MAKRPLFIPNTNAIGVTIKEIDFIWYSGYSIIQKQKSIKSMHDNALKLGYANILEISTKSPENIGSQLSAFNLSATSLIKSKKFTVEVAFQSSKIFEKGGPYLDILETDSRSAKKDLRLKTSGKLVGFRFFGRDFPLDPPTYFYDWLYINTLMKNNDLFSRFMKFKAFTDIEFNPKKSINCQAYSAALFASMLYHGIVINDIKDPIKFLEFNKNEYQSRRKDKNIDDYKLFE